MSSVEVSANGPLFNGQAAAAMTAFANDAEMSVAEEGVRLVRQELGRVLKNPTGAYESRITSTRLGDAAGVTDNRAVYGGWLEGTSSRNSSTRFKGYSTFRRTVQAIDRKATDTAQRRLPSYLGRMQ